MLKVNSFWWSTMAYLYFPATWKMCFCKFFILKINPVKVHARLRKQISFYKNVLKTPQSFLNTSESPQELTCFLVLFCCVCLFVFTGVGFHHHNIQKGLFSWVYSASDPLTVCSCLHLSCFCCVCAHIRYTLKENYFLCLSWLKDSLYIYKLNEILSNCQTNRTQRIERV